MFDHEYGKGARIAAALVLTIPALAGALAASPSAAAEYDMRIQGRAATGELPRKPGKGDKDTVAVVGEGTGETEYLAADEIANAVASAMERGPNGEVALRVVPVAGKGGIQNVRDVLTRPNMDFGIAPVPVLEAAAATDGMGNLRKRLAYVAPMYFEEVHLIAGAGIHGIDDLEGKEVGVGEEGSSTRIVSQAVISSLKLDVRTSTLSGQEAIEAVREGRLPAAFVVSGKPVGSIKRLFARSVRLLSLPSDKVPEGFVPSVVTHEDYPDLVPMGLRIRTYAVPNVLFGYNWPANSPRGRIGATFLSVLLHRLPDLQVGGRHEKWREVNVAGFMPGWRRLPAMQAWLDKSSPRVDGPASREEFEEYLRRTNTTVYSREREALYQDFLRWRTGPVAGVEQ